MAAAAAVGGAAGGLLGAGLQWGAQSHAANKAWRRQKKVLQNQIRWRVADMRAAGLNPILAVSPGAGASAPSVAMQHTPDFARAGSQAAKAATEAYVSKASREQKAQQAAQHAASVGMLKEQALGISASADLSRAQARTEDFKQGLMANQAVAASASAKQADAMTRSTRYTFAEKRAKQDLWNDPIWGPILQAKYTAEPKTAVEKAAVGAAVLGGMGWNALSNWTKEARLPWTPWSKESLEKHSKEHRAKSRAEKRKTNPRAYRGR